MNSETSILLVDDHYLVLEGLKKVLEQNLTLSHISTAINGKEAVSLLNSKPFDLFILDIELPDCDGFDLLNQIRTRFPDAKIIINTSHDELWTIKRMIEANVDGMVCKNSDTIHLCKAVTEILNGESYYCPIFSKIYRKINNDVIFDDITIKLSDREIEVIEAIIDGNNTSEIAEKLCLSENTIESHRRRIMAKMGARNVADMVVKAIQYRIVTLPK